MFKIEGKHNTATVFATSIDDVTTGQIHELCNQKWIEGANIAIMPDTHAGKGCTIGTTITITDKVCPNLVGVDIGCGMLTVAFPNELNEISLKDLDNFISVEIPSGFAVNNRKQYNSDVENLYLEELKCFDSLKDKNRLELSAGSLGGGNHFIEIDEDKYGHKYLIIHTGSRNLGKQVAEYYQNIAFNDCNKMNKEEELLKLISEMKTAGESYKIQEAISKFKKENQCNLHVGKDLCYLEGEHMAEYMYDMAICQRFAQLNRKLIAEKIMYFLFKNKFPDVTGELSLKKDQSNMYRGHYATACFDIAFRAFETVHNYIDMEDSILRKGAINTHKDKLVLIPINMRDGAIIGIGKGNKEYNYSGPHGAGRLMSRKEARNKVSLDAFAETMKGIYSSSICNETLDESPMAYKPMEEILDNIKETIQVEAVIKPIYNFKAH